VLSGVRAPAACARMGTQARPGAPSARAFPARARPSHVLAPRVCLPLACARMGTQARPGAPSANALCCCSLVCVPCCVRGACHGSVARNVRLGPSHARANAHIAPTHAPTTHTRTRTHAHTHSPTHTHTHMHCRTHTSTHPPTHPPPTGLRALLPPEAPRHHARHGAPQVQGAAGGHQRHRGDRLLQARARPRVWGWLSRVRARVCVPVFFLRLFCVCVCVCVCVCLRACTCVHA
jgi:hypothetical protein